VEAGRLQDAQDTFEAETGLDFSFIFALYQGASGYPATEDDCDSYADLIDNPDCTIDEALAATNNDDDQHCVITRGGEPERCISRQALVDAAEAGINTCTEVGLTTHAAPIRTVLMDAFAMAAEGDCVTVVNRQGELVGHACPTDIIGALMQDDFSSDRIPT